MDHRQRHEFRKAAGLRLQPPDGEQVPRPVFGPFEVAIHDRRRGRQADFVSGADYVQPFGGIHLVGADRRPHAVIEDFRRRAGE